MKVYSAPEEIQAPVYDYSKPYTEARASEKQQEEVFLAQLKDWLAANGYTGKHTGKLVYFPHADGRACYMMADGGRRSSCLIHIPFADAWDAPVAHYMPKGEVLKTIENQEKLAKLFGH